MVFQMGLERSQIIGSHLRKHLGNDLLLHHGPICRLPCLRNGCAEGRKHGTHIRCFRLNGQRVIGQGICLNFINVLLEAGGQCHDQGNADDADGTGKGCQQGSGLLGTQIVKAQGHGCPDRHGGFAHILMLRCSQFRRIQFIGIGVANDLTILHPDDPVGIVLRQLRIVGNHDHQPVPGHFLQKLHDLHAGFRIQRAGGFIRQQNVRVIDQRTGNGHPLHLSAGHLIRLFMKLIAQSHILQSLGGSSPSFCSGNTGDGQRQFHIGKD